MPESASDQPGRGSTAIEPIRSRIWTWVWASSGRSLILASLVGALAGCAALLFQAACQLVGGIILGGCVGYPPPSADGEYAFFQFPTAEFQPWWLLVTLPLGGLISGLLTFYLCPEAAGGGADGAIGAFHQQQGILRPRVAPAKLIASAVTLGTGGAGGREGPIAQIGAAIGSTVAQVCRLSTRERRILLAAGMGAGVGAIFRAPLAGALFAGEILYRDADIEADVIVPSTVASAVGYSVFSFALPVEYRFEPLFGSHLQVGFESAYETGALLALACLLAGAGWIFVWMMRSIRRYFQHSPLPEWSQPALGGILAAACALAALLLTGNREVLSMLASGYGTLQNAFTPATWLTPWTLLLIAIGKIVTTSCTVGSGGSAGVFGPSIVIGGCLGGAFGQLLAVAFPEAGIDPAAYALMGMAGFFSGCAHAPFSTIIMVCELTGDYRLLLPTMWTSILCFVFSQRWTLFANQVSSHFDSPAHRGEMFVDLLADLRVADVYRPANSLRLVPEGMTLDQIVHLLADTPQQYFPVVDEQQQMIGIFSAADVRRYLYDETLWQLAVARDVMHSEVIKLTTADDLNTAMRRFTELNVDELPVVDAAAPLRILGMLRRKETIAAYNRRLLELKQAAAEETAE